MLPLFLLIYMLCLPAESMSLSSTLQKKFSSDLVQLEHNEDLTTDERLPSSRIIGGTTANAGEFPFLVSVQHQGTWSHFCGGTLIHPEKVLTACHCVMDDDDDDDDGVPSPGSNYTMLPPDSLSLEAGIVEFFKPDKNRQRLRSRAIIVHPKCEFSQVFYWDYDLAVVTTQSPFKINAYVSIFSLLADDAKIVNRMIKERVKCTTAGWGNISRNFTITVTSKVLLKTNMSLISSKVCNDALRKAGEEENLTVKARINEKCQLCAMEPGKDAGEGNSGGPLICNNLLVGVNSYGVDDPELNSPTVFSRVDAASAWILTGKEKSKRPHESGTGGLRCDIILLTSMWALL